jgi:hypothetical protein
MPTFGTDAVLLQIGSGYRLLTMEIDKSIVLRMLSLYIFARSIASPLDVRKIDVVS